MNTNDPYLPSQEEIRRKRAQIKAERILAMAGGKSAVNKGKRGEDMAAAILSALFHLEARRGRTGVGEDIQGNLPIHCEVKSRGKSGRVSGVFEAIDQAEQDAGEKPAVAMVHSNRNGFIFAFRATDFWRVFDAVAPYREKWTDDMADREQQ